MATEINPQERIDNAFTYLTTHKTLITNCIDQWTDLTAHYTNLDESITHQSETLDTKLQSLSTHLDQSLQSLQQRENALPLLTTRINYLKELALSECEKKGVTNGGLDEIVRGYCRRMDAPGLTKYMSENRKDGEALRGHLLEAVKEAVDQERFVFEAVKDYIARKELLLGLSERRLALWTMFKTVFPAKERRLPVAKSLVQKAGSLAEEWKLIIQTVQGERTHGHVDAGIFLHFLVGFGVFQRFDKEYLRKLVVENPKILPGIVSTLGFGDDEIGDIIDNLLKRGREIDAVNFVCENSLTERFDPVKLLQTHLDKAIERAHKMLKDGHSNPNTPIHANMHELKALRAITKCVDEHQLEQKFRLEGIKARIAVLEKEKPGRILGVKRTKTADSNYHPVKYGRGSSSYSYDRRNSAAAYAGPYRGGAYGPHYGAPSRTPAAPGGLGAAGAQTNYGAYDYSGVAHSSY